MKNPGTKMLFNRTPRNNIPTNISACAVCISGKTHNQKTEPPIKVYIYYSSDFEQNHDKIICNYCYNLFQKELHKLYEGKWYNNHYAYIALLTYSLMFILYSCLHLLCYLTQTKPFAQNKAVKQ